ncbi:MAG: hypothetical protein ACRDF4_07800, partial [Rhabdochlamydiaceae bacterium]
FVPIEFAKKVVQSAIGANRKCPFPNHQSLWEKVTEIARREYNVKLISNFCRKYFEDRADDTTLPKSLAAFLMGDKTKLEREGHLPLYYNRKLRLIEKMIKSYKESQIELLLDLRNPRFEAIKPKPNEELLEIIKEQAFQISELKDTLAKIAIRNQ